MTTALDTRWDAATALLASTVPARRARDHRAKHAVVIGAVDGAAFDLFAPKRTVAIYKTPLALDAS